jgi:hypothetical protein
MWRSVTLGRVWGVGSGANYDSSRSNAPGAAAVVSASTPWGCGIPGWLGDCLGISSTTFQSRRSAASPGT